MVAARHCEDKSNSVLHLEAGERDKSLLFHWPAGIARMAKTDHHPVGTCREGLDDMAAVDRQPRVRGIEGLRVCDSSVRPTIVSSNTNGATIMIGKRGSDLIVVRNPLPPAILDEIQDQGELGGGRSHPVEEAGDRHGI